MFHGYTQSELDAQYDLIKGIPGFEEVVRRRQAASQRVSAALGHTADIAYGPRARMRLDVFPGERSNSPVNLFIHGGYWQMGQREDFHFLAEPFVNAGVTFVNVEYDLCPQVSVGEIVDQIRLAVCWAFDHIHEYGADPERIHVSGHSAGGHLTAMMLITDWRQQGPYPRNLVKSGCAISGLYELEALRRCFLNEALGMNEEQARRLSPLHHIPPETPPLIAAVGDGETEEFLWHNREFAKAWREKGHAVQELSLPGLNHFSILEDFGQAESALTQAFLQTIGK